jgi:hypothetical protein
MKKILFATAFMAATQAQAQTGIPKYDAAFKRFQNFYNAGQADSIYNMFDATMKTMLPLDKTQLTVSTLRLQLGDLKSASLISEEKGAVGLKSVFEKATVKLVLSLDEKNLLNGLFVQPYQE